jgi:hypothetical protein
VKVDWERLDVTEEERQATIRLSETLPEPSP